MDVLVIGSAVADVLARPLPEGGWQEKQRIETVRLYPGGDALNQSIRLADAGVSAGILCVLGKDAGGDMVTAALGRRGVDCSLIRYREDVSTGMSLVLVKENGERHIFAARGAHATLCKEDLEGLDLTGLKALSLASLFSMPLLEDDGMAAFLERVRKKGIPIFADLASDKRGQKIGGVRPFLPLIDFFLPSLPDAAALLGLPMPEKTGNDKADTEAVWALARETALRLRAEGAHTLVIKCGAAGAYYMNEEKEGRIPAPVLTPADVTGAGDCMAALLIHRLLAGSSLPEAITYACAGASVSTLSEGASAVPLCEEEIVRYMP